MTKGLPSRPLDSDGKLPTGRINGHVPTSRVDGHLPAGRIEGDNKQAPLGWSAAQECKQVAPTITADTLQAQDRPAETKEVKFARTESGLQTVR